MAITAPPTTNVGIRLDNGEPVRGVLSVEVEQIDITMATKTEPDMAWTYVDEAGHFHAWSADADDSLPTLDARSEHRPCNFGHGGDCEGYDVTIYTCKICAAVIEPRTVSHEPIGREFMPGRTSWTVEVDGAIERDKRVVVRVLSGDTTRFGVAVSIGVVRTVMEPGADGPVSRSLLHGVGPLGRRMEQGG